MFILKGGQTLISAIWIKSIDIVSVASSNVEEYGIPRLLWGGVIYFLGQIKIPLRMRASPMYN